MTDPRLLSFFSIVFALMGSYSLYTGSRQLGDARRAGKKIYWNRNLSLLTGIEYIVLTFLFLLNLATREGSVSPGMRGLVAPLNVVLLIIAAIVAAMVIHRIILNLQASRAKTTTRSTIVAASVKSEPVLESASARLEEPRGQTQRQRDRRKKAAAARRRQAGKV